MLPREKRLLDTRDFKRVYQKGSFFGATLFTLNFLPSRTAISRLGIVVSKKIEPKAVRRNQIKRKFREVARKLYDQIPPGYDLVVGIKATAKDKTSAEIEKEFATAIARLGK